MAQRNPLACFDGAFLLRVVMGAVALIGLALVMKWLHLERGSPLRLAMAGLQFGVMGWIIAITVGSIRRLDEMQYRIQLEALAIGFALSAIVMTGWGFMSKAGLHAVAWGGETWLVMVLCWALGLLIVRGRYR